MIGWQRILGEFMIPLFNVHCLSGGLDSVTWLYESHAGGVANHCLGFDYGQAHVKELKLAELHCQRLNVPFDLKKIPELGGLTEANWIVPNRNMNFISLAVNIAEKIGADTVTLGCNSEDRDYFPDCRKEFFDAMNVAVRAAGYQVEICAPYLNRSKAWIAGRAREIGVPCDLIWTCYKGGDEPCGKCPACLKLQNAFK